MDVADLQKLLQKAWSKETSFEPDNWTPENPAWGQYAVTALVVQDFFGGELKKLLELKRIHILLYFVDLPLAAFKNYNKSFRYGISAIVPFGKNVYSAIT